MTDFLLLMWKPLLACVLFTGIHTYLGVHVIERKVIFVDLSLAQIAALGAVIALLFGHELHSGATYWFSLFATFAGAAIFALTRTRRETIPQEAIIGIVYAVAASAAVLILSRTAEGDEEIRHMLVGNVLLVNGSELMVMALLYACVGLFHWRFRKNFIQISSCPEEAYRRKLPVKAWDMAFYLTFGLVVTSSVHIAGVLLVFSFLVVPAVGAVLFCNTVSRRLLFGWAYGILASGAGMGLSYFCDLPTGATVVCVFGGLLILLALVKACLPKAP
jgi:zinc/manganese transport system permease protein